MPKVTDEELDRLFRNAAESTHPDFDPGDWDDMSQKLAREEKAAKARNRTLYSVVTLLVLYSIWSPFGDRQLQTASMNPLNISEYSTKENSGDSKESEAQQSKELKEETNVPSSPVQPLSKTDGANAAAIKREEVKSTEKKNSTIVDKAARESTKKNNASAPDKKAYALGSTNEQSINSAALAQSDFNRASKSDSSAGITSTTADRSQTKIVDDSKSVVGDPGNSLHGKQNVKNTTYESSSENLSNDNVAANDPKTLPTVKNEVVEVNSGTEKSASENNVDVDNGDFKSLAEKTSAVENNYDDQREMSHDFPILASTRQRALPSLLDDGSNDSDIKFVKVERPTIPQGEIVVKKDALQSSHQWFIKLPISPDFSSIDYGSTGKTGINIGLLGEFYLNRHFSVSAGAIWSKKLYDQNNPDKVYNAGTWTAKVNKLDGDCRVLDIPLNFTYYLFPQKRTNFFVTLGSSSYIMLNEAYKYTVWKNQQYMTYDQSFSHKNNEWFSMLNVSIGLQQRVGQRFMIQVEPFLKAPMSGVGEGKVNLVSTGAFVSLKYQLTR